VNGGFEGANVHNHVHLERHLVYRATDKTRHSAALAEWQSLMT
jgi:putative transposase